MLDLLIKRGRVIDPELGIDQVADVGVVDGRIAFIHDQIDSPSRQIFDAQGLIVSPGLIDFHVHVYWGGTALGVDPLELARRGACTSLVDTGSAGAGNFAGFRAHVIERTPVRVFPFINIAFPGIFGYGNIIEVGENEDLRLAEPREIVHIAEQHRDILVGVKCRVGREASGNTGIIALDLARECADALGLPLMAHIDAPPPSWREVLARLREGDVLTHAFRPPPNCLIGPDGKVAEHAIEARKRGVLFDIGHGRDSFSFEVAERMLNAGFFPDMISSDVHAKCIDGPACDLLTTLSKFITIGADLNTTLRAATSGPARALGRDDLSSLRIGSTADISVIDNSGPSSTPLVDSTGKTRMSARTLTPVAAFVGGVPILGGHHVRCGDYKGNLAGAQVHQRDSTPDYDKIKSP